MASPVAQWKNYKLQNYKLQKTWHFKLSGTAELPLFSPTCTFHLEDQLAHHNVKSNTADLSDFTPSEKLLFFFLPSRPKETLYACVLSHFNCVRLFVTLWTLAHQPPLSVGFPRQEYWSGLPSPPGDLPDPRIEPTSAAFLLHCRQVCSISQGDLSFACLEGLILFLQMWPCIQKFKKNITPQMNNSIFLKVSILFQNLSFTSSLG